MGLDGLPKLLVRAWREGVERGGCGDMGKHFPMV